MGIDDAELRKVAKQLFAVDRVQATETLTKDEREERAFVRNLFNPETEQEENQE